MVLCIQVGYPRLMIAFLSGSEGFIVLAVVVLLFGSSQLPKLARSLGQAQRELKEGMAEGQEESEEA